MIAFQLPGDYLPIGEAARRYRVHYNTIRGWIRRDRVRVARLGDARVGNPVYVHVGDVERMVSRKGLRDSSAGEERS